MEKEKKRIVRRNLPLNDVYTIIDSYYTGGIENCTVCANCNKPITNVADIKTKDGTIYSVGLDCAETLSSIAIELYGVKAQFAEAKGIRAKINKYKKADKPIEVQYTEFGQIKISSNQAGFAWQDKTFMAKYMPDIKSQAINPEKEGFTPVSVEGIEYRDLASAREFYAEPREFKFLDFIITIQYEPRDFKIQIKTSSGELVGDRKVWIPKEFNDRINWIINKYLFDKF